MKNPLMKGNEYYNRRAARHTAFRLTLHHFDCDSVNAYMYEGIHWDCNLLCNSMVLEGDANGQSVKLSEYHSVPEGLGSEPLDDYWG